MGRGKVCLGLLGLDWVWLGDGILHGILRRSVAWWTSGLGGLGDVLGRPVRRGGVWSGL